MEANGLGRYVVRSIILSLTCFGMPFLSVSLGLIPAATLSIFWLKTLAHGLDRFGWRGLWVLLGAPTVLAWPCYVLRLIVLCYRGDCS